MIFFSFFEFSSGRRAARASRFFVVECVLTVSCDVFSFPAMQDNPQFFANPLQFEIQYECLHDLQHGAFPLGFDS